MEIFLKGRGCQSGNTMMKKQKLDKCSKMLNITGSCHMDVAADLHDCHEFTSALFVLRWTYVAVPLWYDVMMSTFHFRHYLHVFLYLQWVDKVL